MNKANKLLLYLVITIVVITAIAFAVFSFGGLMMPKFFLLPAVSFLLFTGALSLLIKKYSSKLMNISALLSVSMVTFFLALIIVVIAMALDRTNIVSFTILFIIYYIVFLVFESLILMKLTKKDL